MSINYENMELANFDKSSLSDSDVQFNVMGQEVTIAFFCKTE